MVNGVVIKDVGPPKGRLDRIFKVTRRVFHQCMLLDSDIYHFHDPELIPVGLRLKRKGKKVIFDSHEDVPKQLLGKPYLNNFFRAVVSALYSSYESFASRKFDAIVAATPFIRDKFKKLNSNVVDVCNFPILGELLPRLETDSVRKSVCYVGGISVDRGARESVLAIGLVKAFVRLELAGRFSEKNLNAELSSYPGWSRVDELGFIDREGIKNVMSRSIAGLVTLHPAVNYVDALPIKMFEYMSAGIPVVSSDFPLWREIVEGNDCGLCVDPLNPQAIADSIDFLVKNPGRARQMGLNGQRAVNDIYNWSVEESKLFRLYSALIDF